MDLKGLILKNLAIDKEKLGKIYTFVDFGNIDYWYEHDMRDGDDNELPKDQKLVIDLQKLAEFTNIFSEHRRFYFGVDPRNKKSYHLNIKARSLFDYAGTKPIQRIKHYLRGSELQNNISSLCEDLQGKYIYIQKCNFDVEIALDAARMLDKYNSVCLLSSDSDFAALGEFLHKRGKKFILISAGYVSHWLTEKADLNINAQQIKKMITFLKQKPRL